MIDAAQLNSILTHANGEGGQGIDCGASDDAPITQMETGAMPGTLDNLPFFERPFIEWFPLMRTGGPNGRDGVASLQQNGGDTSHVHPRQLAFGKVTRHHDRDILI
jgi:hypothetical protein